MAKKCWKLKEDSASWKEWQNKNDYRRIIVKRIGFNPKKAEWDVDVESGKGKKGFKSKAKALPFAKSEMKKYC